jgi:hypothetical protein
LGLPWCWHCCGQYAAVPAAAGCFVSSVTAAVLGSRQEDVVMGVLLLQLHVQMLLLLLPLLLWRTAGLLIVLMHSRCALAACIFLADEVWELLGSGGAAECVLLLHPAAGECIAIDHGITVSTDTKTNSTKNPSRQGTRCVRCYQQPVRQTHTPCNEGGNMPAAADIEQAVGHWPAAPAPCYCCSCCCCYCL